MMHPCNAPDDVQQFCQLLRLDPESRFTLRPTENTAGTAVCYHGANGVVK